ncbi:MAG: redoxin domain-containing protein [Candidatus Methylomirabilia bacterium]
MECRLIATALVVVALLVPGGAAALMKLRLGDAPPPFDLVDLSGKRLGSDALAGGAAVVLFWSTWSPRSAEMLDDFKRHAAAYAAKGLKIVAINNDGENLGPAQQEAVREYAAARALPFPVLLDEGLKAYADWGVMAHPTEVVLDAGGRIAYVLPGYPETLREELEEAIKTALGIVTPPAPATRALSGPQEESLALAGLGRQFLSLGDPERARDAFRRAAAADPDSLEAAVMVARVSLSLGSPVEAERLVRQVSPEAINRGDLRYLLGSLMLFKGDLDAAERTFRSLQERLPAEGWGHWGLGLVALARGDHRGALASMEQAARLQPENPEAAAFVRRYFRDSCQRQESFGEEAGFVKIFPALAEIRARYCRVFDPRRPAAEKAAP